MSDEKKPTIKILGYLEKKGNKMKMMSAWKLKWFVLKGRLLLYYRSKDEYESLSSCKGSINLGLSCSVKPILGTTCVFQIKTRARTIILKAKTRLEQEKWLQAILSVLNQNATTSTSGIVHFRYSSDDLSPKHLKENLLTRQNTMPERHKVKKRQTFCGSFENILQPTERKLETKYASTRDVRNRKSEEIVNDLYCTRDDLQIKSVDVRNRDDENLYYRISSDSSESAKIEEVKRKPKENIYSKITCDYVTQMEMDKLEGDEEMIIENDQYCTASVQITDTKESKYHEYNIPQKDNIYSVPNVDQNENRIATYERIGPYSICNIYPKSESPEEAIYDNPLEVLEEESKSSKVDEIAKKYEDERKPQLPKKMSFLKKFFKLRIRKKSDNESEDIKSIKEEVKQKTSDGDLINRNVLDELQKLLNAKRENLQKSQDEHKSDTQAITKKMLEELQLLLISKKDNLRHILKTTDYSQTRRNEERIYQEISDVQLKNTNKNDENEHTYENTNRTALVKIDKILNDLDNMKKTSKPFTNSKVKSIIAKFNSLEIADIKEVDDDEPVVLREKNKKDTEEFSFANSKNSEDELSLLLSELAKVINAPILTPGVTSSLNVTPIKHEGEFQSGDKLKVRRHSDPDYDVPRPHTNLNILKVEVEEDDGFVATRFFGPVLSNYEGLTPMSITPDSLEVTPCSSEVSSYHSHVYGKIKQKPYYLHKQPNSVESETKEVYIDSLDIATTSTEL